MENRNDSIRQMKDYPILTPSHMVPQFTRGESDDRAVATGIITQLHEGKLSLVPSAESVVFQSSQSYRAEGRRMIDFAFPAPLCMDDGRRFSADLEVGDPFEFGDRVYVKTSPKKDTRLTNFRIEILSRIRRVSLQGVVSYLRIALIGEKMRDEMEIRETAFSSLASRIQSQKPAYRLYPDSGKHISQFKVYLSQKMEEANANIPEQTIYTYAGWQKLDTGGWHYFLGWMRASARQHGVWSTSTCCPMRLAPKQIGLH